MEPASENLEVEICYMRRLVNYLKNDPSIDILIKVDKDLDLLEVAQMLHPAREHEFITLMTSLKVLVEEDPNLEKEVKCVRTAPFYLYQYL